MASQPSSDPPSPPCPASLAILQAEAVRRWKIGPFDNPYNGFDSLVCQQHEFNFRLWHEEDKARSPSATDEQIAATKRTIDQLNQARNDWIEKLDDAISEMLADRGLPDADGKPINTETPGSAIDRLSIMALRLFHYREQFDRGDVDAEHKRKVVDRIEVCEKQHADLANSLQELLDDIFASRKQHRTYRQLKMYNDATLNPAIYRAKSGH